MPEQRSSAPPTSRILARLVTRTRALDHMGSTSGPLLAPALAFGAAAERVSDVEPPANTVEKRAFGEEQGAAAREPRDLLSRQGVHEKSFACQGRLNSHPFAPVESAPPFGWVPVEIWLLWRRAVMEASPVERAGVAACRGPTSR